MRRSPSKLHISTVLLCLAACAPVVTHGPRVEPGWDWGLAAGWRVTDCDSCGAGLVPPIGTIARYGWTPDGPEGLGYSIGAMVPGFVLIPASTLDFYVQAPAPPDGVVVGGGLTAGLRDVMPYVQAGRQDARGRGWYTTQGLVLAAYRPEPGVFLNGARGTVFEHVSAVYWSPTLAWQGEEITLYASAALGSHDGGAEDGIGERHPLRALLFGATLKVLDPFAPVGFPPLPPRRR